MMYPISLATKLFKKCKIYAQNPIYTELFLVKKKNNFYCINTKNMSIRKINGITYIEYPNVMFSSNGLFFVIIDNCRTINVFNSKTLQLINSFELSSKLNIGTLSSSIYNDIDTSEIEECVLYNEYLICKIDYMREAYLKYEYGLQRLHSGTEVYNIITGNLVTNNFNLKLSKLYITNNNVICSINNKEHLCKLTPQLDIIELSNYNFKTNMRTHISEENIISFDFVKDNDKYKLCSLVIFSDDVKRNLIDFEMNSYYQPIVHNIKYIPEHNLFMVVVYFYNSFKILLLDKDVKRCIFDFNINIENKFYILDNYSIVYDYNDHIYKIETPFNKISHLKSITKQFNNYYLPDELLEKILYAF